MATKTGRLVALATRVMLVLTCVQQLPGVSAYPSGAPDFVCSSMIPRHGASSLTYTRPFILVAATETYSPLQLISVTIEPMMDVDIRGFFIQARPNASRDGDTRIGSFLDGFDSKAVCSGGAVTHSYSANRLSATVSWRAPPVPQGDIVFRATVVRRYSDYYTEIYSSVLSFQEPTTTKTPAPTTTTTTISTTTATSTTTSTTAIPTTTATPTTTAKTTTLPPTTSTATSTSTTSSTRLSATGGSKTSGSSPATSTRQTATTTESSSTSSSSSASSSSIPTSLSPTNATGGRETEDGSVGRAVMLSCNPLLVALPFLLLLTASQLL